MPAGRGWYVSTNAGTDPALKAACGFVLAGRHSLPEQWKQVVGGGI
jgi:hypothetical protein